MKNRKRILNALNIATQFGGTDSEHHKMWVIDQMVRALTNETCAVYSEWAT